MSFWNHYPYTDFHEINLDWIIEILKEMEKKLENFVATNSIKYANPFQWSIVNQYEKNTLVIEPNTETAYLSVQAVPQGVNISNTDYWTPVFDLTNLFVDINRNFTAHDELLNVYSSANYSVGDWVLWKDKLYKVISTIQAGDALAVGTNIEQITIESVIDALNTTINGIEGRLTTAEGSIVNIGADVTKVNNRFANMPVNIADYPREAGEITDDGRFARALADCGGTHDMSAPWYGMTPCRPLYLPADTYIVSTPIDINVNNLMIYGDGMYNTKIKCADNVHITGAVLQFTEAYGCCVHDLMIDGNHPYTDISGAYGADAGLWFDQTAYLTVKDVCVTQCRYQSIRLCHVWESYFENIYCFYSGMVGSDNYAATDHAAMISFSPLWKRSTLFPSAESNELVFNKIGLSGHYGTAVEINAGAPIQNGFFNDIIEENGLFNWLGSSNPLLNMSAWYIAGADTYVTINGIYVYEHNKKYANKRHIFDIEGGYKVNIKDAMIATAYTAGTYTPYADIVHNAGIGALDAEINVTEYGGHNQFDYIVNNISQYGVTCKCTGNIGYECNQGYAITDAEIFNDPTRFYGFINVRESTGNNIRFINN